MLSIQCRATFLFFSLLFISSCHSLDREVEEVIGGASPRQQKELKAFIGYYANDKKKQKIAKFIIANLDGKHSVEGNNYVKYQKYIDSLCVDSRTINNQRGYNYKNQTIKQTDNRFYKEVKDLNIIKADSLIKHMNLAFYLWNQSPWSKLYSDKIFEQYISPYRIVDEPLEYYWRADAYQRYKHWSQQLKDSSLVSACSYIYQHLDFNTNNLFWGEPLQSYSANVKYRQGTCSDQALYTTMVMRALGIPTSIDFIPYWGDNNNGHSFNSLLMPDGTCKGYNNKDDLKNGLNLSGKVPKVYRKVYEIQRNLALYKYQDTEYIPDVFARHDVIDVTNQYDIPLADVTVNSNLYVPQTNIVYLSVYSPGRWCPVAWAECIGGKATFKDVGVGYTSDESPLNKGENYGEGCLFLSNCFKQERIQPLTYPFILKKGGETHYLIPDTMVTEKVVLHRKFPRKKRIVDFAKKMIGGYFELSNDRDFKKSELVYFVDSIPSSHQQTIMLENDKKYRYMRFYKRNGGICIGEMGCLTKDYQIIRGTPLADSVLLEDAELNNICDGTSLSYFDIGNLKDVWVGIDFGRPMAVSALYFCPRTDDNDITHGNEYELLYWNKEWVSLGSQVAIDYQLSYQHVPRNSLLWLRNRTKGKEERPFTYENEKQIWW